MAVIKPPSWCKNAVPTTRGWCNPKTGELLKAVKIRQDMIDNFNSFNSIPADLDIDAIYIEPQFDFSAPEPVVVTVPAEEAEETEIIVDQPLFEDVVEEEMMHEEVTQVLTEAPANDKSLEEMTKVELEALGRQHGIELDRRKNKKTLVERMKSILD